MMKERDAQIEEILNKVIFFISYQRKILHSKRRPLKNNQYNFNLKNKDFKNSKNN